MAQEFRCDCPITSSLDVLGDRWMLVIVKQMLLQGFKTFKEFSESDEAVSSNILSTKLKYLEKYGLIQKTDHPTNKKSKLYTLTEMGLSLTPVIVELALWSDCYLREFNPIMSESSVLELARKNKGELVEWLKENYQKNQLSHE